MTDTNVNVPLAATSPSAVPPVAVAYGPQLVWYPLAYRSSLSHLMSMKDGGTWPAPGSTPTGWTVGDAPSGYAARANASHDRPQTAFTSGGDLAAQTKPDTYLGDSFLYYWEQPPIGGTKKTLFGTFAEGNWTLEFGVIPEGNLIASSGKVQVRLWHGKSVDGSDAVEFVPGTVYDGTTASGEFYYGTRSTVTAYLPETHLDHEYVFVQVQWCIVGGGSGVPVGFYWYLLVGDHKFLPQHFAPEAQLVDVSPAHASPTAKTPTIVGGIVYLNIPPAHAAPTAVTPVTAQVQNVDVPKAQAAPSSKTPTIEVGPVGIPVSPAHATPHGIDPTIEGGTAYINVAPAHAASTAKTPNVIILDGTALYLLGTTMAGTNFLELAKCLVSPTPALTSTGWELCGWFSDPYAHQDEFCRMSSGVEQPEYAFTSEDQLALATRPDNDLGDCLIFGPWTGAFPTQDWYLDLCVQGHHSDMGMGTFKVQLMRGFDRTGLGALPVGTVHTGPLHQGFSTSSQTLYVIPMTLPPVLALDDEFLFFKVEWWNTGPLGAEHGGSDALLCIGPNACVRTPLFVASTVYKAVPLAAAHPTSIAPSIRQQVTLPKAQAHPACKTPSILQGVNVSKAASTASAKTPSIIAQAVNVPLAASHPTAKKPTIAIEGAVPDVHANPSAKTPRISLGITIPWAASSALPLNPSIGLGAVSIPTTPARAHPTWVAAMIAAGLTAVSPSPAQANPGAVEPSTGNAPVLVALAPASASAAILGPTISRTAKVLPASASPSAKSARVKFTYPKAEIMKLRVGAVDPQAMSLNITSSAALPDLTAVLSAQISVFKPDRSEVTWDATISNQTASGLTLTHLFQATDLDLPGAYELKALLTTSSGIARTEPVRQYVAPAWEI